MLLKKGSRGEEVKQLQKALGVGADGIFGSGTEAVVKKFQKDNGLAVDGLVGPGTWEAIGIDTDSFEAASETEYTTRLTNHESVYIACFAGCTYHCG